MARTQGHGNPDWTRDETILALALLFECGEKVPSPGDPRIERLSTLLRQLPYHAEAARRETFRNPAGVGFKLSNLRSAATGRGLSTSEMDRAIWKEFGPKPEAVKELGKLIEASILLQKTLQEPASEESPDEFFEGRLLTLMHQRRERHPGVRKALLKSRKAAGPLACEICARRSPLDNRELEDALFEAHHLVALALAAERKTQIRDMALLCANCHRLIHRLIAHNKRWLTLAECRAMVGS